MKKFGVKKYAFTLAETLIALTIIGVCAAMVIPSLKNLNEHTMNTENEVMAKKTITNFSNATSQILMNSSKTRKMDGVYKMDSTTDLCTDANCMFNLYGKYLSIVKQPAATDIKNAASLPGTVHGVLADGVIFGLTFDSDCELSLTNVKPLPGAEDISASKLCGYIYFDTNGTKGPNATNRDRFVMPIYKTGIKIKSVQKAEQEETT